MPTYRVAVDGQEYLVEIPNPAERPVRAIVDGELFEVQVEPESNSVPALIPAASAVLRSDAAPQKAAPSEAHALASPSGVRGTVAAPLPGTIVSITVSEGDRVEPGQELCVLEAMKMNNPIRSTQLGVVREVLVTVGQQVQHGNPLMVIAEV